MMRFSFSGEISRNDGITRPSLLRLSDAILRLTPRRMIATPCQIIRSRSIGCQASGSGQALGRQCQWDVAGLLGNGDENDEGHPRLPHDASNHRDGIAYDRHPAREKRPIPISLITGSGTGESALADRKPPPTLEAFNLAAEQPVGGRAKNISTLAMAITAQASNCSVRIMPTRRASDCIGRMVAAPVAEEN